MRPATAAEKAHLRMLEAARERERLLVHEWEQTSTAWGFKRTAEQERKLAVQIRALRDKGMAVKEIAAELSVGARTVKKHLGLPDTYRVPRLGEC